MAVLPGVSGPSTDGCRMAEVVATGAHQKVTDPPTFTTCRVVRRDGSCCKPPNYVSQPRDRLSPRLCFFHDHHEIPGVVHGEVRLETTTRRCFAPVPRSTYSNTSNFGWKDALGIEQTATASSTSAEELLTNHRWHPDAVALDEQLVSFLPSSKIRCTPKGVFCSVASDPSANSGIATSVAASRL